ncbi:MAG: hypothetical protein AB1749_02330 [Pseudomonadota bacterium]
MTELLVDARRSVPDSIQYRDREIRHLLRRASNEFRDLNGTGNIKDPV